MCSVRIRTASLVPLFEWSIQFIENSAVSKRRFKGMNLFPRLRTVTSSLRVLKKLTNQTQCFPAPRCYLFS